MPKYAEKRVYFDVTFAMYLIHGRASMSVSQSADLPRPPSPFVFLCNVILGAKVLLEGEAFSGKTALMAHTSVKSDFPFIRKISADEMIGHGEV